MSTTTCGNKLVIDLDEDDTEAILSVIRTPASANGPKTTPITKVTVEYGGDEESVSCKDEPETETHMTRVFAALGDSSSLQRTLQHLQIHCGDHGDLLMAEQAFPVSILTNVLDQCQALSVLCLDSMRLTGPPGDFDALAHAVARHSSLACVCWSMLSASFPKASSTAGGEEEHTTILATEQQQQQQQCLALEPVLIALADLSTLRVLELDDVPTSRLALQRIGQSTSIQTLELWNIPNFHQHMNTFLSTVASSNLGRHTPNGLKSLEICSCQLDEAAGLPLLELLAQPHHHGLQQLESVVLEIEWGATTMFGIPIAALLQHNQTLRNVHLICVQQQQPQRDSSNNNTAWIDCSAEAYAQVICRALGHNRTLERLTLEFQQSRQYRNDNSRLERAFSEPLRSVLEERNHTLHCFHLTGGRCTRSVRWNEEIQFYLHLNQAGRSAWTAGAYDDCGDKDSDTANMTLKHLVSVHQEQRQQQHPHKYDVSTLFYLLSMHPHLLCSY